MHVLVEGKINDKVYPIILLSNNAYSGGAVGDNNKVLILINMQYILIHLQNFYNLEAFQKNFLRQK